MRRLQFLCPLGVLTLMGGCAMSEPRMEDQSILEVVDPENMGMTSARHECAAGEVTYCLTGPVESKACSCLNALEVERQFRSRFERVDDVSGAR
jgi:hypothetical protein